MAEEMNELGDFDVDQIRSNLFTSSTKRRTSELHILHDKLVKQGAVDAQPQAGSIILNLLLPTYAFYTDRPSRQATRRCLVAVFTSPTAQRDLDVLKTFLQHENAKQNLAPSSRYVLLEWCATVLQHLASSQKRWSDHGVDLVQCTAKCLDAFLASQPRESRKHAALVTTRRAIRTIFKSRVTSEQAVNESIETLAGKSTSSKAGNAPLLGVIAGVASRLPAIKPLVSQHLRDFHNFYIREILGSRMVLPIHVASGLDDFFTTFESSEALFQDIVPALEKSLLRAPEVVLNDLITPLIQAIPSQYDFSEPMRKQLLKSILPSTKSANVTIREGALSAYRALIRRCRSEEALTQIAEEILKNLKDAKSTDQRVLLASMLAATSPTFTSTEKVPSTLSVVVPKETNEAALQKEVQALGRQVSRRLSEEQHIEPSTLKLFSDGLRNKKTSLRRIWALSLGEILWPIFDSMENRYIGEFGHAAFECLGPSWSESISNPVSATQSGLAASFYILFCFSMYQNHVSKTQKPFDSLVKLDAKKQLDAVDMKQSLLLNTKIFTKITAAEDLSWFLRALVIAAGQLGEMPEPSRLAWAQAMIFLVVSSSVPARTCQQAAVALTACTRKHPLIVPEVIIHGIWRWISDVYYEARDTAVASASTGVSRLGVVVRSICVKHRDANERTLESLNHQMIHLLVLCRTPLVGRVAWIDICLRTGIDPYRLVSTHKDACIHEIKIHTNDKIDPLSKDTHDAACRAAAELAFIAQDSFTPSLIALIESDLATEQLKYIGPEEAAIYRTPEGVAFVDVLSKKNDRQVPNKNTKDYDLLKWEEDLRSQIAQKQGQQKKLTVEEATKVKSQLEKESEIRRTVTKTAVQASRALGIIRSLATGPPSDTEAWIGPAIYHFLLAVDNGLTLIVGEMASTAYLALSRLVASRLGPLKLSIGISTLRAKEVSALPEGFQQEPLGDLITRVLYRLRFSGEQRPFDAVSLFYILPLIYEALSSGGIGKSDPDEADEQITLAIEFLSFHVDRFSNSRLPRTQTSVMLIAALQKLPQHYRALKECLMGVCHALAPEATDNEIDVFLRGCIVPQSSVRQAILQAIDTELDITHVTFSVEIWLASHDDYEENAEIAVAIWEENELSTTRESVFQILPYLESEDRQLRNAAARALADCVKSHDDVFADVMLRLKELYVDKARPRVPEKDAFGLPRKVDLRDPWESRHGIALAFKSLAGSFNVDELEDFTCFLIDRGPLSDRSDMVRDDMVEAATRIVSLKGASKVEQLLTVLEATLDSPNSASAEQDKVNEAVIILYGATARHLKTGDARVPGIVDRLLTTLATPSETVQYAVADCLPPLVQASVAKTPDYLVRILEDLLHSKKYATRRGAAYGLAGIVRGKGLMSLRESRIMSRLQAATEDKKDSNQRQGVFLAYELLSLMLGRTFEPYVIQIVPQLLVGFGDPSADVRDACLDASKTCFSTLSSFGVKKILPTLLEGLEEVQWRSKKGACDSLGAMAYLDPQQLAVSLPEIIPSLTTVLNDSHKEVRGAANRSLQRFGEVISNPEIKSLVNILLKALSDPTKYTEEALDSLLKVSFAHYLDAPSLALVVRILERGLGDRSQTKRKSAQIIGSLAHLTDRKDLISHLPILVSGLRVAAVDPVPTTRATASKALGTLVEKLGEDALPDLIPSLMATLKTDTGAGDRLGSAQALSEVLAGLGVGRLEETLPSILQNVSSSKATVREGFMSMFIFLPACFGNSFANYLAKTIPPILSGLADEVESIRETSLRAGRLLVKNFANRAIDLLLPELQRGLGDLNYRIRLSSVELVGDLLFNLTGISVRSEGEEELDENTAGAQQSLLEALGEERRANVLSALYISRCDTSGLVRSSAMQVWKTLVATPRTLREITPTLTQVIIRRLASPNAEQKHIAGNALGELIRKAGEGVLSTLLPTLEEGLETSIDTDAKQGICIALRELISSASQDSLEEYEPKLISVVRTALVDGNVEVREAAADAFDSLQKMFGKKVIDQILPYLLGLLRDEDSAENALAALLTLLTEQTRSNVILPTLLPTLLASPISAFNARALASLASVASSSMVRRLSNILNALLDNIVTCKDEERLEALDAAFDAITLSMDEFDGLNALMSVMLGLAKNDDHRKRQSADMHLATFFSKAEIDYSRYHSDLIRTLLIAFDDNDRDVVKAAWTALSSLTSKLAKEDMDGLVVSTRQVLGQVGVIGHDLAGFQLPKGINAILPIFLHGLVNGSADQKVQAALAISELIDKTGPDALKPFVTNITGPLIRVISERSTEVKAAILITLNNLLEKIPTFLKPFLPQLQRTFTKSLADPSSDILRMRAARALGTLITLTPRIDPLIGELVNGSKTSDPGVKNAMQKALFEVVSRVGKNMNESSRNAVIELIDEGSLDVDEPTQITNARLMGALIKNLSSEAAHSIVKSRVLNSQPSKASILALNAILLDSPQTLTEHHQQETVTTMCKGIGSGDPPTAENSALAVGKYLLSGERLKNFEITKTIFEALVPVMQPGSPIDTRRLALVVVRTVARRENDTIRPHLAILVPPVFASVRDTVIPIKLASEAAFLGIFNVVEEETAVFDKYMAGPGANLPPGPKRAMGDYFKRVALRLAGQARERREAEGGGDGLGLSNDEREDEKEIWSVGKVDLGDDSFTA